MHEEIFNLDLHTEFLLNNQLENDIEHAYYNASWIHSFILL